MMVRQLFALVMLGLWVPGLGAEEPPELPKPQGFPPTVVLARMDKDGQFRVRAPDIVLVPSTREVLVKENGQTKKVTVPVDEPRVRIVEKFFDGKDMQVFGTDGKQLETKDVAKALEKETPVLLSADANKVDPFYLRVIKEGTLILVPKRSADLIPAPPPMPKKE
jgi:hypothetical protein